MPNYAAPLGLDEVAVSNLADVHYGYARYLSKEEDQRYTPYIASSFLIAAIFRSFLDPKLSISYFRQSSLFYQRDNNSFWIVAAICADEEKLLEVGSIQGEVNAKRSPNSQFSEMLKRQFTSINSARVNFDFNQSAFQAFPVGRLGLPLNLYLNAFNKLDDLSVNNYKDNDALESWGVILERAFEKTRLLQSDIFHWTNLKGNFIPYEPEILASCIVLCKRLQKKRININSFSEYLHADRAAKTPLLIAMEIIGRSENEDIDIAGDVVQ
jgi:hypothetical protein